MWTLEVVRLHEQRDAPLTVGEVREDSAREKLVPHRLPEPLDLPARLRMVRTGLHVPDPVAAQLLLEVGLATPCGVLPALIGEDLARRAVVRDCLRERFHHERAPLVMRHHERYEKARVVVHERGDVDPLVLAQQEREQVRLPELVWLGALEPFGLGARLRFRCFSALEQAFLMQNAPHRRLRDSEPLESLKDVANPPRSTFRCFTLRVDDGLAARVDLSKRVARRKGRSWCEAVCSELAIASYPIADRRMRYAERFRDGHHRHSIFDNRLRRADAKLNRPRSA